MGYSLDVEAKEWPDFLKWFRAEWAPGQHVAVVAPTGQGKTTFLVGILGLRKFSLAFDPKGGDTTLRGTGFPRLSSWPPARNAYRRANEKGEPMRFLVGPVVRTVEDLPKLRECHRQALAGAFGDGGWTVAIDEFQIMADRRMMGLGTDAEKLFIAARDKGVSVVSLFQAPRWVPRAASDQARFICLGLTRDTDVVNRYAEILGRPKAEIRGALKALGRRPFSWLVADNNPRAPLVVTIPDKVKPARP